MLFKLTNKFLTCSAYCCGTANKLGDIYHRVQEGGNNFSPKDFWEFSLNRSLYIFHPHCGRHELCPTMKEFLRSWTQHNRPSGPEHTKNSRSSIIMSICYPWIFSKILLKLQPTPNSAVETYDKAAYMLSIYQKRVWREVKPTRKQQHQPEKSVNHTQELISRVGSRYHRIYDTCMEREQEKSTSVELLLIYAERNHVGLRTF